MSIPIIPPLGPGIVGTAVAADQGASIPNPLAGIGEGWERLQRAIAVLTNPEMLKRIGVGILGAWLIWLGFLAMLASSERVRGAATSAVGMAVPGGSAVAGAVKGAVS